MTKRREISVFNIAFLDLLSGALGAVIILYIAVPKSKVKSDPVIEKVPEMKIVEDIKAKNKIIAIGLFSTQSIISNVNYCEKTIILINGSLTVKVWIHQK